MKGFVIYSQNQSACLSEFLSKADGCNYTPVVAVSPELIEAIGSASLFNVPKAKSILHREVTAEDIARTLSHIECWRKIAEDSSIDNNEFSIIAETGLTLSPHYFKALNEYVDGFLVHSTYDIALLERSRQDTRWDDKIYTGEGSINSAIFEMAENYDLAYCKMYLIRKSLVLSILAKLDKEKPYWLSHRFTDFCDVQKLIQTLPFIAEDKNKIPFLPIKVKSMDETLDFILENPCSVIRFGDGEFILIKGNWIVYQKRDPKLAAELESILRLESSSNLLVCIPAMFDGLSNYTAHSQNYWRNHLDVHHLYYESICTANEYGNAFIFRPYMDWQDKSQSAKWFAKLQQLWQDKDLLIVEGETSRSGVGNDLFDNVLSIKRIICPATDAYSKIDEIEQVVEKYSENKLILLMLGPTAKALTYRLSQKGIRAIDIGHIDSEYEWFKMGTTEKVKFTHKHTADFNEADIQLAEDAEYESQIIARVSE